MVSFSGRKKERKKSYLKHLHKLHPLSHKIFSDIPRAAMNSEGLARAKSWACYRCVNALNRLNSFLEALPREMENDQTPIETRFENFAKEIGFSDPSKLHSVVVYGLPQDKIDYFASHFVLQIDAKPFTYGPLDPLDPQGDPIDLGQNDLSIDTKIANFTDSFDTEIMNFTDFSDLPESYLEKLNDPFFS